jgi:hypothetical protein
VEEFAEQRKLISRLSSMTRGQGPVSSPSMAYGATAARTPYPGNLSGTAIRPPSQPGAGVTPPPTATAPVTAPVATAVPAAVTAVAPPATTAVLPANAAPSSGRGRIFGLAVAAILLLGAGVYGGAHLSAWTSANAPAVAPATRAETASPPLPPLPASNPPPVAAVAPTPPNPKETHPTSPAKAPSHVARPKTPKPSAEVTAAATPASSAAQATSAPPPSPGTAAAPAPSVAPLSVRAGRGGLAGMRVIVYNDGDTALHSCEIRLPDNRHYFVPEISAHEDEGILLAKFRQDGPYYDKPLDHVVVHCKEGASIAALGH